MDGDPDAQRCGVVLRPPAAHEGTEGSGAFAAGAADRAVQRRTPLEALDLSANAGNDTLTVDGQMKLGPGVRHLLGLSL